MIISILVPQDTIFALFESIFKGSVVPDEVVVVDQSDNDATKLEVEKFESSSGISVKYKKSKRRGLCANRNDCIAEATGDFLIFIDQDMTVDKNWLKKIIEEWTNNWEQGFVVVSGRTLPGEEFEPNELVPSIQDAIDRKVHTQRPKTTEVLYGAYFGASKKLFESLKPKAFDERLGVGTKFPGADDTDFAYRVIQQNYPIVFEPQILAYHHPPPRSWRKMRYDYAVGIGAYIGKHLLLGDIKMIGDLARNIVVNLAKGTKAIFKNEEPEGSARLLASVGFISGFFRWILLPKNY